MNSGSKYRVRKHRSMRKLNTIIQKLSSEHERRSVIEARSRECDESDSDETEGNATTVSDCDNAAREEEQDDDNSLEFSHYPQTDVTEGNFQESTNESEREPDEDSVHDNEDDVGDVELGVEANDILLDRFDNNLQDYDMEKSEIRDWIVDCKIPHNHADRLLKILRRRLLPNLPQSTKTLLDTASAEYVIKELEDSDGSKGEYAYLGIKQGLLACVNTDLHESNELELMVNVDGIKLFKSSIKTFWPILCKVHFDPDIYKPFAVALYSGNCKPKKVEMYLRDFITEINQLQTTGIVMDERNFKVKIKCFICDTPARALLKCIKGHTAFDGCERCSVHGQKVNKVTVFLSSNEAERTNESFRNFTNPEHHLGVSPLIFIEPHIDMIHDFILDSMHLTSLGVMKRLTEASMGTDLNTKFREDEVKLKKIVDNVTLDPSALTPVDINSNKKGKIKLKKILDQATVKPPAVTPIGIKSNKRPRVISNDEVKSPYKLRKTPHHATVEPPASTPIDINSQPGAKVQSEDEIKLRKLLANLEPLPVSSVDSSLNRRVDVAKKNLTKISDSSKSCQSTKVDCHQPSSSNSKINNIDKDVKYKKQFTASAKADVHQILMDRVQVLQSEEPTDKNDTVFTLCLSMIQMLNDVKEEINAIKQILKTVPNALTTPTYNVSKHVGFCEKFQVALPFKSMTEFLNFDKRLRSDKCLHESFLQYLSLQIVVEQGMPKNIILILKLMFTRDIAMRFTAVKRVKDKHVIKETVFALCFYDIIRKRRTEHNIVTSEQEFYSQIGIQLTNSKDWNGHRSLQRQAQIEKDLIIQGEHENDEENDGYRISNEGEGDNEGGPDTEKAEDNENDNGDDTDADEETKDQENDNENSTDSE